MNRFTKRQAKKAGKKLGRKIIIIVILAVIAFIGGFINGWRNEDKTVSSSEIDAKYSYHFIDVGQGDCTLILGEEASVLIDAGPGDHASTTVEYIKQLTDTVDIMILTHPHEDHIGGADDILNELDVRKVVMPDASSNTAVFEKLLNAVEAEGCDVVEGKPGVELSAGGIEISIYGPVLTDFSDLNDASIFAHVKTGDVTLMFTGDGEKAAENAVLEKYGSEALNADILHAGHHGSSTSNTLDFFNAVSPDIAVISCGKDNSYGHPHSEILKLFEEYDLDVYRTDKMGTVVITSDGEKIAVSESYT